MISRLLMTRTFVFPLDLFVLIFGSLAKDTSVCSTWELDHDSKNNLDSSIILWEKNDCPLIDCALFCGMNPYCRSFYHHPSIEKCVGSQSYKRALPDSQDVQQGWNYYTRPQHCDSYFIYNKILGVCYKYHETNMDYWDAMAVCEAEGAKLLIIRNDAELNYFSNLLPENYEVWIGLRGMMANNTVWRWWNGQTASLMTWYHGNPNDYNNETCVVIRDGTYNNFPCANSPRYFLCQRHM